MKQKSLFHFEEIEEWSYSKLKTLARCPKEYNLRYRNKQDSRPNIIGIDAWAGRIIHKVIEEYFKSEVDNNNKEFILQEIYNKIKPEKIEWVNDPQGDIRMEEMLKKFINSPIANYKAVGVEVSLNSFIKNYKIRGRADLVWEIPDSEGSLGITDFKLVEEKTDEKDESKFFQLLLYTPGIMKVYHKKVIRLALYSFETGTFKEITPTSQILRASEVKLQKLVATAHGERFIAKVNQFCPSCPFAKTCEEYQTKKKAISE